MDYSADVFVAKLVNSACDSAGFSSAELRRRPRVAFYGIDVPVVCSFNYTNVHAFTENDNVTL